MYSLFNAKYVWILLALALAGGSFSENQQNNCVNSKDFSPGIRLKQETVFVSFNIVSIGTCIKQCLLRRKCQAITFNRKFLTCDIGLNNTATEEVLDHSYMTSNIGWTPQEDLVGLCAYHNCKNAERCVELNSKQIKCIPIDCRYQLIKNGILMTCYILPQSGANSYYEAEQICKRLHGRIPRIDTEDKYRNFLSLPGAFYWIEGVSSGQDSSVFYEDGTPYTFYIFATENNNLCSDLESCGVCLGSRSGLMYHREKSKAYAVVCEMYP